MRRTLIAGVAVVVALAACTSGDDEASDTETTATTGTTGTTDGGAEAIDDPRAPGVSDDELLVGVTYVDFTNIRDITGFDHGDYEAAYQAVFDEINENGGVHGRQLVPVFAPVDPLGSEGAAVACTELTQDQQVFVVMGFFLSTESITCYLETNGTAIIGGNMTNELLGRATAPWYTTDPSEDLTATAVEQLAGSGQLDGTVAVVGVAGDEALYEGSVAPALDAAGIAPVEVAYIDISSGDTAAAQAEAQTVAERFSADGADQVLLIGTAAGVPFNTGLVRTDYRPQLIFTDLNAALTYSTGETNDLSLLDGALSAGPFDPANEFLGMGGATEACVETQTAAGLELVELDELPAGACAAALQLAAGLPEHEAARGHPRGGRPGAELRHLRHRRQLARRPRAGRLAGSVALRGAAVGRRRPGRLRLRRGTPRQRASSARTRDARDQSCEGAGGAPGTSKASSSG